MQAISHVIFSPMLAKHLYHKSTKMDHKIQNRKYVSQYLINYYQLSISKESKPSPDLAYSLKKKRSGNDGFPTITIVLHMHGYILSQYPAKNVIKYGSTEICQIYITSDCVASGHRNRDRHRRMRHLTWYGFSLA